MSDILLILIILINKKINSTRLEIVNFRNENFQIKLNPLQKYNYENLIKQKYQRYFSILEQKQKIIETMIDKFDANNYQSILTEIIMFNETMVSR
jgi:hypothetical protein